HAIRILRSAGVPARLRLIGDSLDGAAFRSVIEAKIRLLDLTGYVDLIGLVRNKRDKIALLHTSDAFAGCFIRSEPFGLVVLEAMATGLPVVVPDTGAAPEILHRTAHPAGRLYRTNDTGQLADQLRWLHEHPAEARRMGQAGREAVARYFHAERMAHDVRAVFDEAIASRRQQRTQARHRLTSDVAV
ncbi:MAG: glycosyltransferase, partial [Chloroflexota bacterium]|nr:glycosyltransferase [Chloroflexota bacterium]